MYDPKPINTDHVVVPEELNECREQIAEHVHDHWALTKIEQGKTDATKLEHPDLIPYSELTDDKKAYDRQTADATIKLLLALGYQIVPPTNAAITNELAEATA